MTSMQKEFIAKLVSEGKTQEQATEQVTNGFLYAACTQMTARTAYIGSTESPSGATLPCLYATFEEAQKDADDVNEPYSDDDYDPERESDDEACEVMAVKWDGESLLFFSIYDGKIDPDYVTKAYVNDASGL